MAAFKEPKKFGVIPGNAADVTAIQDAGSVLNPSMTDLFPAIYQHALSAGGKAPERTTFNALFKMIMERLYFIERGGVWSYDATADYPAGAVVGYSGSLYLALKDNGSGTDAGAVQPDADGEVWQKLPTLADVAKAFLLISDAEADYLKKSDASGIYLSKSDAKADYLKKSDASGIYLSKSDAEADYLKKSDASGIYLSKSDAKADYLKKSDASGIYLSKSDAKDTYQTKEDLSSQITTSVRSNWYSNFPDGAEAHNAMWGGRDITASFNNGTVSANIANGTFRDIFPGDYITKQVTISGKKYTVNWVIADCDYWINKGDTAVTVHHVAIVPQAPIFDANMNATNTTEGGYMGSRMFKETIPACATGIVNAFGASHILTFRDWLISGMTANQISSGLPNFTGGAQWDASPWVSVQCDLMTEKMVLGAPVNSASALDEWCATRQMSAFRLSENLINYNRQWYWLRNIVSSALFAYVYGSGSASPGHASYSFGVRPFALLV